MGVVSIDVAAFGFYYDIFVRDERSSIHFRCLKLTVVCCNCMCYTVDASLRWIPSGPIKSVNYREGVLWSGVYYTLCR